MLIFKPPKIPVTIIFTLRQNLDLWGTTLRAIQPNPPYDMLFMSSKSQRSFLQKKNSKEASCKKKKKSYGTVFWENSL